MCFVAEVSVDRSFEFFWYVRYFWQIYDDFHSIFILLHFWDLCQWAFQTPAGKTVRNVTACVTCVQMWWWEEHCNLLAVADFPWETSLLVSSLPRQLSYNRAPKTAWADWKKDADEQKWDPVWHSIGFPGGNSIKTLSSHKHSDLLIRLSVPFTCLLLACLQFSQLKLLIDSLTPPQARVHLGKTSTTKPDFLIRTEFTWVNTVLHSSAGQNSHLKMSLSEYMQV